MFNESSYRIGLCCPNVAMLIAYAPSPSISAPSCIFKTNNRKSIDEHAAIQTLARYAFLICFQLTQNVAQDKRSMIVGVGKFLYSYNVVNTDGPRITCALSLHPQPKSCQDPFVMATKTATTNA
jgi:hypothetical protein